MIEYGVLEINKKSNCCEFNIVKYHISNKSMGLTNLQEYYGGYATHQYLIHILKYHIIR